MARLLLLSNGHGEDLSGALLGQALQGLNHQVEALPLVGCGDAYTNAGIATLGQAQQFSTGGLGYTSLRGRLTELFQGQIFYLLRRVSRLLRVAHRYELVIVIGDVIPVMAAWLSRRPVVTYLVAYSSHYEGRLRLPWPCGSCLASRRFLGVYSRDQRTATDLSEQLQRSVQFLGNPFMDPVLTPKPSLPGGNQRIGLLPGSRRPELEHNLLLLLQVVEQLPEPTLKAETLSLDLALVSTLDNTTLATLVAARGWQLQVCSDPQNTLQLVCNNRRITLHRNAFITVLQSSDLLLCMAGTATEQAVGLAKPVLQLPGKGPQFTPAFAEAQRRLLGPTVFCASGEPGENESLCNTAALSLELLKRSASDQSLHDQCHQQAQQRLGAAGGGKRMAAAITGLLNGSHPPEPPPDRDSQN